MKKILPWLFLLAWLPARAQVTATNEPAEASSSAKSHFPSPVYPHNVQVVTNVAYLGAGREESADVYSPLQLALADRLPGILIIHGGGFNDGDKARPREINIATNLVTQGYVCVSINYRLRRKAGEVTWPQAVYDAKTAIRWLRATAAQWHIDPARIGVIGCSAGGNLATMLALTRPKDGFDLAEPYGKTSSAVSCAVDFYGAVNLPEYHDMKMFGRTRAEAPELYVKASPVTYVYREAPPILIVHGTADATVPLAQSQALDAALTRVGAEHQLVVVPGAPHTFHLQPKQRDLRPLVFDFFAAHLKSGPGRLAGEASASH
jgi:acetyl esterase/lipase